MEHFKKHTKHSGLNLVSLMDIFTILVFFLLVSSSNVQQLPNSTKITLPSSVAKKVPKETIIIAITKDTILVQGRKIGEVSDVLSNKQPLIKSLEEELKKQASKSLFVENKTNHGRSVTIMGDENIPYQLLSKILTTCRQANYTQIAFAALQKTKG